MTRFLLLLCAAFLLAGCGAKGVTVVDKPGFVTMSQRMPQEMKARGLLTDDGSYISLPGGGGENYGEILFRQLSPEFLFNDRGHVYLGSTFAATRTPSSHATVRKTGFTIVHPTQTINLAMLGIVDWNKRRKGRMAHRLRCPPAPGLRKPHLLCAGAAAAAQGRAPAGHCGRGVRMLWSGLQAHRARQSRHPPRGRRRTAPHGRA